MNEKAMATTGSGADVGTLVKDAFGLMFKSENLVPLLVGALLAGILTAFSLGILAGPMILGYTTMSLKAARGQPVALDDLWGGFKRFGVAFVAGLIMFFSIMVGMILLVIPGLIAGFLMSFTFVKLADHESMSAVDAIKASIEYTKARVGELVVVVLVAAIIAMVLGFVPIVGGILGAAVQGLMISLYYVRTKPAGAASAF